MRNQSRYLSIFTLTLSFLLVAGCGSGVSDEPKLATVTGKIHLDGKPLSNVVVTFSPVEPGGRPSSATTNSEGVYELVYSAQAMGAQIGQHKVTLDVTAPTDDTTNLVNVEIPPKYSVQSELTAEVKPGENTIDFVDLTSK